MNCVVEIGQNDSFMAQLGNYPTLGEASVQQWADEDKDIIIYITIK